ncbi:MAG: hypothetical protein R6U17_02815 [Thermoplasmata archaeon]
MEEYAEGYEKKKESILDSIQDLLFPGEMEIEGTGYERSVLDRRIEKYLDKHFDEYIQEYDLVRELDLEVYEEKYIEIVDGIEEIKEFQKDVDSQVSEFKRRLASMEKML